MAKLAFENALLYQDEVLHPKWIVGPLLHLLTPQVQVMSLGRRGIAEFSDFLAQIDHGSEVFTKGELSAYMASGGHRLDGMRARNLDWRGESGEIRPCRIDGGVLVSTLQVRQRRHAEDGSLAS